MILLSELQTFGSAQNKVLVSTAKSQRDPKGEKSRRRQKNSPGIECVGREEELGNKQGKRKGIGGEIFLNGKREKEGR